MDNLSQRSAKKIGIIGAINFQDLSTGLFFKQIKRYYLLYDQIGIAHPESWIKMWEINPFVSSNLTKEGKISIRRSFDELLEKQLIIPTPGFDEYDFKNFMGTDKEYLNNLIYNYSRGLNTNNEQIYSALLECFFINSGYSKIEDKNIYLAHPILESFNSPELLHKKIQVLNLILQELPEIDKNTPIEKLIQFKNANRTSYYNLHKWLEEKINNLKTGAYEEITHDKLWSIQSEYNEIKYSLEKELRNSKIKVIYGSLKIIVSLAEFLTDWNKFNMLKIFSGGLKVISTTENLLNEILDKKISNNILYVYRARQKFG